MITVVPMTITAAKEFIEEVHRHHRAPQGGLFAVGAADRSGKIVGASPGAGLELPVAPPGDTQPGRQDQMGGKPVKHLAWRLRSDQPGLDGYIFRNIDHKNAWMKDVRRNPKMREWDVRAEVVIVSVVKCQCGKHACLKVHGRATEADRLKYRFLKDAHAATEILK